MRYFDHVYTRDHNAFNCTPRAVLNISRDSMAQYGFSPATRVFEAAGAGACLITDAWEGIEQFLEPGREVLVARDGDEVAGHLRTLDAGSARGRSGAAACAECWRNTRTRTGPRKWRRFWRASWHGGDRMNRQFDIVILGLSVTSSWGNGHATTYRGLIRGWRRAGIASCFWSASAVVCGQSGRAATRGARARELYESFDELMARFEKSGARGGAGDCRVVRAGRRARRRLGASVASGVTAFYDIDTPVTLANWRGGSPNIITPALIRRYHLYLSFTGGSGAAAHRERSTARRWRGRCIARWTPTQYRPSCGAARWDLGYLGTYSDDRQPVLEQLLLEPARRWTEGVSSVVGPMYPEESALAAQMWSGRFIFRRASIRNSTARSDSR